jgi:hypothetical protein
MEGGSYQLCGPLARERSEYAAVSSELRDGYAFHTSKRHFLRDGLGSLSGGYVGRLQYIFYNLPNTQLLLIFIPKDLKARLYD